MLNEKNELVRVVEIIWCKIPNPKNNDQVLVEMERIYADGGKRSVKKILGGKRRPLESIAASARRSINKELTLEDRQIRIDEAALPDAGVAEDTRVSPSYPGLTSVYRVHIIPCEILLEELDEDFAEELGLASNSDPDFVITEITGDKHAFRWMSTAEAASMGSMPSLEMPEKSNFDSLVPCESDDFNWTRTQLTQLLDGYGIKYDGTDAETTSKNVDTFLDELKRGEVSLWENSSVGDGAPNLYSIKTVLFVRIMRQGELWLDSNVNLPMLTLKSHESLKAGVARMGTQYEAPLTTLNLPGREVSWGETVHTSISGLPMIVRGFYVDAS
jgi:hypothetical protein